ncbi:helix-turn-helix domain-containing protein [Clostridium cellulovorans]|uniref:Transcriptional regulator, AraC family n=1 Tax=Clostridium cellulovorans (strain ATCC 35296 / DSM 3052 / OCM 3 / 743B) TaxID=573061 RepID=D9SWN0_CLOC7|nr:AraC family transcriptional regulator [Clostridium cellulovorans]ADL53312.1 transcriptional regulator, AraC family [Clostridium cellulovorans 743B]
MINNAIQSFGFLDFDRLLDSPLYLYDFGIELRQDEFYDFHNEKRGAYPGFLLQCTLEGCGTFEADDKTIMLTPGKAFFITFPDSSRYYLPTKGSWKFFYIHFDGELASHFFNRIQKIAGKTFSIHSSSQSICCFLEEYQNIKQGRKYERYDSGIFLYQFLSTLQREIELPLQNKKNAFVEDAEIWIQRNYKHQVNLSVMCQNLGVSFPHLTRQFHAQKGITPMQYLTQLRLEQSLLLLLNTTMNINEIATECGFANGNYFAKVFRKAMAISPSEYRERYTGKISSNE